MSNIIDINELREQFAAAVTVDEWKKFAEKQAQIIERCQKELSLAQAKCKQLEYLLGQKMSIATELTPEEAICLQQISRLENASIQRELTLEEVKRLDLLVKNLKLIREEGTIVVDNRKDDLKEHELVAIIKGERPSSSDNSEGS